MTSRRPHFVPVRMTPAVRLLAACAGALAIAAVIATVLSITSAGRSPESMLSRVRQLTALQSSTSSSIVTQRQIQTAGDTAAATVLRWWQRIQSGAAAAQLIGYYAPSADVSLTDLRAQVRLLRGNFRVTKPIVLDVVTGPTSSEVDTVIGGGTLLQATKQEVKAYVWKLRRIDGRWLMTDNTYLRANQRYSLTH